MKFEYKEPDAYTVSDNYTVMNYGGFTGLIKVEHPYGFVWSWLKNGHLHRELGPACVDEAGDLYYSLNGYTYKTHKDYWAEMYVKYRGTEHEELCMIELLASD